MFREYFKGQKLLFTFHLTETRFSGDFVQVIIIPARFFLDLIYLHIVFKALSTKSCKYLEKVNLYSIPGKAAIGHG